MISASFTTQSQYVWKLDEHWEPLWEDIARKFNEYLSGHKERPVHFLGAMVLDQKQTPTTHVDKRLVIDGQQRLTSHKLKPWRKHLWLSSKTPRDADFFKRVKNICQLYTRKLAKHELVLCVDEKTSLQPRTRKSPTRPAQPEMPVRVEHEYERKGALNLFAAFDTRSGKVYAHTAERKRQKEFIEFLEKLDAEIPKHITQIHLVMNNLPMHTGKQVQPWLAKHTRFKFHHPPVHCSWMNQVEQWFSILQRKRLAIADFADKAHLAERLQAFVNEWNQRSHQFNWTKKSVTKIMAKCEISRNETSMPMAA
jgi:transposase